MLFKFRNFNTRCRFQLFGLGVWPPKRARHMTFMPSSAGRWRSSEPAGPGTSRAREVLGEHLAQGRGTLPAGSESGRARGHRDCRRETKTAGTIYHHRSESGSVDGLGQTAPGVGHPTGGRPVSGS